MIFFIFINMESELVINMHLKIYGLPYDEV